MEAELTAKLSSKMQDQLKAEQTKLEEQLRQGSGRRAHKELVWVRHDIRRVLEQERGMVREQVERATGQVREWVVREQRGQLLQQARQLQEEAERFGSKAGVGGDGGDGRGGAEGGWGGGCRDGWRRGGITGVAAGDGSRDRVPFPDQSRARGKGTSIEIITAGMTTMRKNDTSKNLDLVPTIHL